MNFLLILWIRDILVRSRIRRFVPLTYGSSSGSGSESWSFRQWFSRCKKNEFFSNFFASYFLKIHLHQSSKIKKSQRSQKTVEIKVFLTFFCCLMMQGVRIQIRIHTNNDRSRSGRPKNLRIRIHNTAVCNFSSSYQLSLFNVEETVEEGQSTTTWATSTSHSSHPKQPTTGHSTC